MKKRDWIWSMLMGALLVGVLSLAGCSGSSPVNIGLTDDGVFQPCPDSPNCISTMEEDEKHQIGPVYYEESIENAKEKLLQVLDEMGNTEVVMDSMEYIHVEFTTNLFNFIDDVEFLFDDARKTLHFRSASRVGYSDMGANRRRLEEFKERFYGL